MPASETRTLDVPGGVLTYDIRMGSSRGEPVLLLIGSPMDASGFAALADSFTDRTVVTYDPLGVGRSPRADGATESTPDEHADALRRLILALDSRLVDIFGSSGGAVNALALVARHGDAVRSLVAHEPPIAQFLPDRRQVEEAAAAIHETFLRSGFGPGMAKFIEFVSVQGPIPADYAGRPAPDPAAFGLPTVDDGNRRNPLLGPHMVWVTTYQIDVDALQAAPTRIVLGAGADSGGLMPGRAATAVAERLGVRLVVFPGGHGGFHAEDGQTGRPAEFAAVLRGVLTP